MPETRVYPYEAMFLIGQTTAASELPAVVAHIREILARANAQILAMRKWDERRLAYEIRKQKRGLYILTYFRAPNTSLPQIERDCNLSEKILRVLILRADHLTEEEMRAADASDALEAEARLRLARAREQPAERPAPETIPPPATPQPEPQLAEES